MLHDSGLYGPNEAPGTMGAPVNKTGVGSAMDIAPILSNKGSLHHNRSPPSLPQYTPQHYAPLVPNTVPIESQINPFLTYTNARVHSNIHHHIPAIYSQNGLSPFDFNAMMNHNTEFNHSIHEKVFSAHVSSSTKSNSSWCPKNSSTNATPQIQDEPPNEIQTTPKDAINQLAEIPILYNKKHTEHPKDNYDLQSVSSKSKNLIDLRTERIENTFRRIESIIATDISSRKRALESSTIEIEKEQTSPKLYEKSSSSEQSESDDDDTTPAEPQRIEIKIEQNVDASDDNGTEVEIKLEKMSWTDSDFRNPFIHDQNGVTKDNIDSLSKEIVGADRSFAEAKHFVKYGLSMDTLYYECPHCSLHFAHPKRFLVHHNWHTFGLTNLTRQIQALAKEARAAVRSGELPAAVVAAGAGAVAGAGGVFPCRECDKVFQKKSTLKRHKTKAHKRPVTGCRICNASVSDWRELRAHHAAAHPHKEQDGFKCDKCEKVFKLKHNLTKHAQSHFEKIHPCPHCPKLFATETIARKHQRCHSDKKGRREAKHHCSYCGKSFTENFNLQAHERSHRNERPYRCTLCSSAYATNSSLKRHVRVSHNAAKPFTCETCHKSFSTANTLNRHQVREHTDLSLLTHGCSLCPNKYRSAKDLRQHVYKVHARRNKGPINVPVEVLIGQQDD